MSMFDDLTKTHTEARKARDEFVTGVLSQVVSDLKYKKINEKKDVEDGDVLSYLQKQIKSKKDAIEEFRKGNRQDLVDKEQAEIDYLAKLLPAQLSAAEIVAIVAEAKVALSADGPVDMGKLMKEAMARMKGRADGGAVRDAVQAALK